MRFNSEITLYTTVEIPDGFGGNKKEISDPIVHSATVSVANNELKAKPSGLGYYRIATIMLPKNILDIKDSVEHNGVSYSIEDRVLYEHSFLEVFKGYEV